MALRGKAGATLAGRYRLLEQLGEGGMGSVWKAEHLLLHSHVAVKIVDPDVARLEFNLARFLREKGAENVSVTELDYVFSRENPLYERLTAALGG